METVGCLHIVIKIVICCAFVLQQLITHYRAEYMALQSSVHVEEYKEEVVKLRVEKVSVT